MVESLAADDRLRPVDLPLVALLHKLAESLEMSSGKGASVALLSKEFRETRRELAELAEDDTADVSPTYDVVLLPVADAS